MRASFYNIGCKVNFAEMSEIQAQFEEHNYTIVDFSEDSEIKFINTCSVTSKADADSRKIIRRVIRNFPDSIIIAAGCSTQLRSELLEKIEGLDYILGNQEKFMLFKLFDKLEKQSRPLIKIDQINNREFHKACSVDNESRTRAVLKIQDGCDYFCAYCTVPFARGRTRSMDLNEVIDELYNISNNGFYEVVLSGINLGEYKAPSGENFVELLKRIELSKLNLRIRISSIEPNLLTDEIIEIVSRSNIFCNHFHIPLQSGSDEILQKMRRKYNTEIYRKLIEKIKNRIPDCGIGADVIVGFPGENDELFEQTYNFINSLDITYLHCFSYSERDNTDAVLMKNKVPAIVIKERTNLLRKLSDLKKNEFYKSMLGTVQRVIPETYYEKKILFGGWTDNYIRVDFEGKKEMSEQPCQVILESINKDKVFSKVFHNK